MANNRQGILIWASSILALLFSITQCIHSAPTDKCQNSKSESPLLLILAFDGLGADFLNPVLTPNLWKLAREGAWAPRGVKPQFQTVTAANFYSISTGLYEENHGIIGNSFYDPDFKEVWDYWNLKDPQVVKRSREAKWFKGEPIWLTNQKAGHKSGSVRWPLSDANINNQPISRVFPWDGDYSGLESWKKQVDLVLSYYTDPNDPVNLGFLYIPEPDHAEHDNDIYSEEVREKIAEVDKIILHLVTKLKALNLYERMNIIFVCDHGHTNVYTKQNTISLDRILRSGDYIRSASSIFPNTTKGVTAEDLYNKLNAARMQAPQFDLFWKEEMPERYHYKNNKRIGPIVLFEHLGYSFDESNLPVYGNHGYSNDYAEMRPAFFVKGPAFKSNFTIDWEIENTDLYNLMANVLQLQPAANDGNFSRVQKLLKDP